MYDFRSLKGNYLVTVSYRQPDYSETEYTCKVNIEAKRKKDRFLFTIVERLDVKLNKEVPEKIMDYLMMQLGNSLYPLELNVTPEGEIISVENFTRVRENWNKRSSDLLKENPTQAFKNYIDISRRNFSDEPQFRKSLLKDTFFQLFFQPYGKKIMEFDCFNFPRQSKITSYYVCKEKRTVETYSLHPSFLEADVKEAGGKLNYKYVHTGELFSVDAEFYLLTTEEKVYKKKARIIMDTQERRVKTGFIF